MFALGKQIKQPQDVAGGISHAGREGGKQQERSQWSSLLPCGPAAPHPGIPILLWAEMRP